MYLLQVHGFQSYNYCVRSKVSNYKSTLLGLDKANMTRFDAGCHRRRRKMG